MKVVLVGVNHAGTNFAKTFKALNPEAELNAYDMNDNVSFLGCGIALWVAGEFKDPSGLFYSSPEALTEAGVNLFMGHKVIDIDTEKKEVLVKDLSTGKEFTDSYDKLVFSGGTWPIIPPIPGLKDYLEGNTNKWEKKGIFLSKWFQHAQAIIEATNSEDVKNVVVCGAGYIGIELVEAFHQHGKNVTLIDMENRIVPRYFDTEFTDPMMSKMAEGGIKLAMGEKVDRFEGTDGHVTKVVTNKATYDADLVIFSIGFAPQTQMLKGKVNTLPNGAIVVDETMRSSNPDIYALGDSAALYHNAFEKHMHVALATNAVKTGVTAAMNLSGNPLKFPGIQGTNGINVFGCMYASTGLSEETCKRAEIKHAVSFVKDMDRPEFMHNAEEVRFKIVYDPDTLRLLGAQVGSYGQHNHSEVMYAMSLAIAEKKTLPELALMDVYFLPHYNKPFNFILTSILKALGLA